MYQSSKFKHHRVFYFKIIPTQQSYNYLAQFDLQSAIYTSINPVSRNPGTSFFAQMFKLNHFSPVFDVIYDLFWILRN